MRAYNLKLVFKAEVLKAIKDNTFNGQIVVVADENVALSDITFAQQVVNAFRSHADINVEQSGGWPTLKPGLKGTRLALDIDSLRKLRQLPFSQSRHVDTWKIYLNDPSPMEFNGA